MSSIKNAKSQSSLSSPGPVTSEDIQKMKLILETLISDPKSVEFIDPVDAELHQLLDYHEIIKKPMCLSFVRRNLSSNKYNWVQEFIDDVQLIWSNCKTYNQDNSEIWKMADHLEKVTRKTIEKFYKIPKSMGKSKFCFKLGKNFYPTDGLDDNDFLPPEINLNEEISLQEKFKLADSIREIDSKKLGKLINALKTSFPNVLIESESKDKLVISVEKMNRHAYDLVYNILSEKEPKIV